MPYDEQYRQQLLREEAAQRAKDARDKATEEVGPLTNQQQRTIPAKQPQTTNR